MQPSPETLVAISVVSIGLSMFITVAMALELNPTVVITYLKGKTWTRERWLLLSRSLRQYLRQFRAS